MSRTMSHCNGSLMVGIGLRTNGPDHNEHQIFQVAFAPLDSDLNINKDYVPLLLKIRPDNPGHFDKAFIKKLGIPLELYYDCCETGVDQNAASLLIESWVERVITYTKFGIPRKIIPISVDYSNTKIFMENLLMKIVYDELFHHDFRDPRLVALYINDKQAFHAEKAPYGDTRIQLISSKHNMAMGREYNLMNRTLNSVRLYKDMCQKGFF